ncbi:hypothetical protein F7734_44220 [Scytonema sp. UIC 10036]|uniref:hypothetical protein n=1 Tax=Scytonema sp. UIC 10036 TaxID=2304196 RepID=UPI0012DA1F64|nr:hypothetical protein [Scytonema sp. UIC 10036]MUG98933.1 hypothetical protein [Scytonema sp. UIC 10036]
MPGKIQKQAEQGGQSRSIRLPKNDFLIKDLGSHWEVTVLDPIEQEEIRRKKLEKIDKLSKRLRGDQKHQTATIQPLSDIFGGVILRLDEEKPSLEEIRRQRAEQIERNGQPTKR